jgi:hypothetical protein
MSVTDDEAVVSKIVREINGDLPETHVDPVFLVDRVIICPLNTQVDRINKYFMEKIPGEIVGLYIADKVLI